MKAKRRAMKNKKQNTATDSVGRAVNLLTHLQGGAQSYGHVLGVSYSALEMLKGLEHQVGWCDFYGTLSHKRKELLEVAIKALGEFVDPSLGQTGKQK